MDISRVKLQSSLDTAWDYIEVLKPRETGLLVFIGIITALVAGRGTIPPGTLALAFCSILLASAGANGLTNYLDRSLDARMERTRYRALPSGKIQPAEKVLPLTIGLTVIGLAIAWQLHPLAFYSDLIGTAAALIWRKRVTCVFPQGAIASCAPVLMGWFAVRTTFSWEIILLCILIAVWLPSHIWSIMIAHRQEYINAGINYFPLSSSPRVVIRLLVVFCFLLYGASIGLYFAGHFGWLYLVAANILGIIIVYASLKLLLSSASKDAWRLYKLSAFPYLGVIFLVMFLSILIAK